jgi:uncharacterized protein YraI
MRKNALAAGLMLILMLGACNLGNTPGVGGSETVISGVPVVRIASPLPNALFLEGVTVNIQAAVTNAGADIDRVEVVVDNQTVTTLPQPNTGGTPTFSIAQSWEAEGAGSHTIAVTAFRADGSSSAPATVTITIVEQGASAQATPTRSAANADETEEAGGAGIQAQPTVGATSTPAPPTETPPPAATDTPSKPVATFLQGVNVRSGPSTKFNPPIGSFLANQTADILGKTPAGDWYKVTGSGGTGWVFGELLTVSGDASRIPVDAGPPVPTDTPVAPTPVPATATPSLNVNLVAGNVYVDPAQPRCGQTFNIFIDIANSGTNANAGGGTISVRDEAGGNVATTNGAFGVIQPGQTAGRVGPIPLTVSTNFEEQHKLILVVDSGSAVAETNEGDNTKEFLYTLAKAGC